MSRQNKEGRIILTGLYKGMMRYVENVLSSSNRDLTLNRVIIVTIPQRMDLTNGVITTPTLVSFNYEVDLIKRSTFPGILLEPVGSNRINDLYTQEGAKMGTIIQAIDNSMNKTLEDGIQEAFMDAHEMMTETARMTELERAIMQVNSSVTELYRILAAIASGSVPTTDGYIGDAFKKGNMFQFDNGIVAIVKYLNGAQFDYDLTFDDPFFKACKQDRFFFNHSIY